MKIAILLPFKDTYTKNKAGSASIWVKDFIKKSSVTIDYLKGKKQIKFNPKRRKGNNKSIIINGARGNNLKNVTIEFPLAKFIGINKKLQLN